MYKRMISSFGDIVFKNSDKKISQKVIYNSRDVRVYYYCTVGLLISLFRKYKPKTNFVYVNLCVCKKGAVMISFVGRGLKKSPL